MGLEPPGFYRVLARSPFISPKNLHLESYMVEAQHWADRVFRRDVAARCCGIRPGTLDVLIHRMDGPDVLFSERQGGRQGNDEAGT